MSKEIRNPAFVLAHLPEVTAFKAFPTPAEIFQEHVQLLDAIGDMATSTDKKQRRRSPARKVTERQLEALKVVGECEQNFAEAARRLGRNEKTIRQHYSAGLKNAGGIAVKLLGKPKPAASLPLDRRGQVALAESDEGAGVQTLRRQSRRMVMPDEVAKPAHKRGI